MKKERRILPTINLYRWLFWTILCKYENIIINREFLYFGGGRNWNISKFKVLKNKKKRKIKYMNKYESVIIMKPNLTEEEKNKLIAEKNYIW